MSTTLDHGLVKPANLDRGATWFPQLAANVQYQSDILSNSSVIAAAGWGSDLGGGNYRQIVTIPTILTVSPKSFTFDTLGIEIRTAAGVKCAAKVEKISATTFYVYTNDNTVDLVAIYNT